MQSSTGRVTHSSTTTTNQFDIDGNTYTCKKCRFIFTNRDAALKHYRAQHYSLHVRHSESEKAWKSLFSAEGACSLCDFRPEPGPRDKNTFDTILRNHLDTGHPGKRREVIYAAFDRTVQADNTPIAKLNRVCALAPEMVYACTDCTLSFSTAQQRLQHCNDKHPIPILQASMTCSECGKVFSTIKERRTHRHIYPCRHCAEQFSTDAGLKLHLLQCSRRPRKQFRCPLCGEFFDTEPLLKAHLAMKHLPTQLGKSSKQVEIVRGNGRKRQKLEEDKEEEIQCISVSPKVNGANESAACSRDCVEPKKDSAEGSDHNALISFAIVKDEVEDNEIERNFLIESETKPETFSPSIGNASIDLKHEADTTGDGDLSEMTVSVTTCKEESDN